MIIVIQYCNIAKEVRIILFCYRLNPGSRMDNEHSVTVHGSSAVCGSCAFFRDKEPRNELLIIVEIILLLLSRRFKIRLIFP